MIDKIIRYLFPILQIEDESLKEAWKAHHFALVRRSSLLFLVLATIAEILHMLFLDGKLGLVPAKNWSDLRIILASTAACLFFINLGMKEFKYRREFLYGSMISYGLLLSVSQTISISWCDQFSCPQKVPLFFVVLLFSLVLSCLQTQMGTSILLFVFSVTFTSLFLVGR